MSTHPVAVAPDVDDVTVVEQAGNQCGRHDLVPENLAPLLGALVAGEKQRNWVRQTDLAVAVEAAEPAARPIAAEIVALLGGTPAGEVAAPAFREIAGGSGEVVPDDLRPRVRGAAVTAARIAAAHRDPAFFRAAPGPAPDSGLDPSAGAALARFRDEAGSAAPDWAALQRDLTALLAALAR
jgi:hypothetical protein